MKATVRQPLGLRSASLLLAALACFVAVAGSGALLLRSSASTVISDLHLEGDFREVSPDELVELLLPLLGDARIPADLELLRLRIEELPWVARARVQRLWPSALRIKVWERHAVARYGDDQLLDSDARRFSPGAADLAAALPLLHAPDGREREVLDAYRQLSHELAGSAFEPASLTLDARGEWLLTAAGGIAVRMGREPPRSRVALIRGAVSRALDGRVDQVRYVDLRYGNGFSVGWSPQDGAKANG